MYKIQLTISNPQTGDSTTLTNQFDPTLMTQAKWTGAWPTVQTAINNLVTASTPKEPTTW